MGSAGGWSPLSSRKCGVRLRRWGWITTSLIVLGPTGVQKPHVLQFKALRNTDILTWWVQWGLCVTLWPYFLCSLWPSHFLHCCLSCPWKILISFPQPHPVFGSSFLQSLNHSISLPRCVDDSGQFWGREAGECLCCGHVEQDLQREKCQIWDKQLQRLREDIVLQGAGVICSAASCWSDTLQR